MFNERLPVRKGRRLLISSMGVFLGRGLLQTPVFAQEQDSGPNAEGVTPFQIGSYLNIDSSKEWQSYPGRNWRKATIPPVDSSAGNVSWEKILVVSPEMPVSIEKTLKGTNWSMGESLFDSERFDMLQTAGNTYLLCRFELSQPSSIINAGIVFRNEADRNNTTTDRRRIMLGTWGNDLYFAYWNGNPEGKYTIVHRSLARMETNNEGKIQVNTGIVISPEGDSIKVVLPNSEQFGPISLEGTSLYDPTGKKQIDAAVSTTDGVVNTLQSFVVLRPSSLSV